ncbi:hypothetical protein ATCC90586_002684 [Pythium insidiosum]|nr:hypothetical protein ATCC90586_002684 [Pythium insidiosum]
MFYGARRGMFRTARQAARAAKNKQQSGYRHVSMLVREESALGGAQRRAFGRQSSDTIARALAVTVGDSLLNRDVIDALSAVLSDLVEEDDDGR